MTIYEKLQKIQHEMKAPKNLYNSFGKYNYRNAEGICEAFKPFGEKYGVAMILEDRIFEMGGRIYVEATARLIDTDPDAKEKTVFTTALARESQEKKGMDDAQITGATSSYARKYALNGLFLLDDTKDPDTEEYQNKTNPEPARPSEDPADKAYPSRDEMIKACEEYYNGDNLKNMLKYYKVSAIKYLNGTQLKVCYNMAMKGKQ